MDRGRLPEDLDLRLASKRPARLFETAERRVLAAALPEAGPAVPPLRPEASIVVLTHGNLAFTRMCLESVLACTEGPSFELIVVDNASGDATPDYLRRLAATDARVRPFLMSANLGFAGGVNAGMREARGESLVILNNDTVVAPGWLAGLLWHLGDPVVGLVGPVTNQAPGVARVTDSYRTFGEFVTAAGARSRNPRARDVEMLTLFCAALPRQVWTSVGPLDERFELGMFEDDDYCLRVREAGLSCRLAEDVLVHHFGEASFGSLVPDGTWKATFDANRSRFEQKWGLTWAGHTASDAPDYVQLIERLGELIQSLPDHARVLVATRGDDRLCATAGREAGHFPQLHDGTYAGSYPADDAAAIRQLRDLADRGWTHLALPNPARWWLSHYPSMARHLDECGVVVDDPDTAVVFRIGAPVAART
jgi:GT2 family glycosyltransferase